MTKPQPPATHEHLGPFKLTTRTVADEDGQRWLEAELVLSSGRQRIAMDQDDGNAQARARARAIDAALGWLDKLLAEAVASRMPDDEDQEGG